MGSEREFFQGKLEFQFFDPIIQKSLYLKPFPPRIEVPLSSTAPLKLFPKFECKLCEYLPIPNKS